ncbi:MAG: hypothetical protein HC859_04160 [Bacteroidia bacterium]|nr:hypothetical protein [Bacteroidia bacterium]
MFRFDVEKPRLMSLTDIKKGYFRLVSEEYFNNVYPRFIYKPDERNFDFEISRRPQRNFQIDFGGVIASRNISNIFLGVNFYRFNRKLTHAYAGFQTGGFYKSAIVKARLDLPMRNQLFLEPEFVFNNWDYLESQDLIIEESNPTILKRTDRRFSINLGWPAGKLFRVGFGGEVFNSLDRYSNDKVLVSSATLDELRLRGLSVNAFLNSSTLNRKQYASQGRAIYAGVSFFNVDETHVPGSTSSDTLKVKSNHQWFRLRASMEQYFNRGWYRPGYYASVVLSNQPTFTNYMGTLANAPAFYPLQDSRTLLLQNFRAFSYAAVGLRNVFALRNRLDFRVEGYLFKPFEYLATSDNQEVKLRSDLNTIYFAGTAGLVLHTLIGPISLSLNYYDDEENQLGVLLHVGFLLFNPHTLER